MGLLDALQGKWSEDPETNEAARMAALAASLGLMTGRGNAGEIIGRAGLLGMQGYGQAREGQAKAAERQMAAQLHQQQILHQQQQMEMQRQQMEAAQQERQAQARFTEALKAGYQPGYIGEVGPSMEEPAGQAMLPAGMDYSKAIQAVPSSRPEQVLQLQGMVQAQDRAKQLRAVLASPMFEKMAPQQQIDTLARMGFLKEAEEIKKMQEEFGTTPHPVMTPSGPQMVTVGKAGSVRPLPGAEPMPTPQVVNLGGTSQVVDTSRVPPGTTFAHTPTVSDRLSALRLDLDERVANGQMTRDEARLAFERERLSLEGQRVGFEGRRTATDEQRAAAEQQNQRARLLLDQYNATKPQSDIGRILADQEKFPVGSKGWQDIEADLQRRAMSEFPADWRLFKNQNPNGTYAQFKAEQLERAKAGATTVSQHVEQGGMGEFAKRLVGDESPATKVAGIDAQITQMNSVRNLIDRGAITGIVGPKIATAQQVLTELHILPNDPRIGNTKALIVNLAKLILANRAQMPKGQGQISDYESKLIALASGADVSLGKDAIKIILDLGEEAARVERARQVSILEALKPSKALEPFRPLMETPPAPAPYRGPSGSPASAEKVMEFDSQGRRIR